MNTKRQSPIATGICIGEAVCDVRYYFSEGSPATRDDPEDPGECYIEEVLVNGEWIDPCDTFTEAALLKAVEGLVDWIRDERESQREEAAIRRHEEMLANYDTDMRLYP